MKFRLTTGIAAFLCVLMASCYPVDENGNRKKATRKPQQTAAEEAKKKEEDARKKAEEDMKKKKEEAEKKTAEGAPEGGTTTGGPTGTEGTTTPGGTTTTPPVEPKRTDYAFATKVPGKEGFVFSPYNNKVVDVRDIPSGTLVQDPTYPASEKKYFRVP
jgi:hypothetical protein